MRGRDGMPVFTYVLICRVAVAGVVNVPSHASQHPSGPVASYVMTVTAAWTYEL